MSTLADAYNDTTAALRPSEDVKEREPNGSEDNIEEVWHVSDPCRSSERSLSVL